LRAEPGLFVSSLVINWLIGPPLMFALAWLMLPNEPNTEPG
jgi:ACR3 family arsenite transporter